MTPKHSRIYQPAVGLLPQHYLIGEGVSLPELLSAPLSSIGAQPVTLMAAAPVRQRSGPGGPRAQLPPCYYEGYLETRGPKEKVGSPGADQVPCCFNACSGWWRVSVPADPPHSQWAVNFLIVWEWARRDCMLVLLGDFSHGGCQICYAPQSGFARIWQEKHATIYERVATYESWRPCCHLNDIITW